MRVALYCVCGLVFDVGWGPSVLSDVRFGFSSSFVDRICDLGSVFLSGYQ